MTEYERETRRAYANEARAAAYHARQTRSWTWSRVSTALERRVVGQLMRSVADTQGMTMLDMPCGTGVAAALVRSMPVTVVAADIAIEMMVHARLAYRGVTAAFVCADATDLPWPANTFDCVLTLGFLHRLPETIRRQAIAELSRVCRRFVIASCSLDSGPQRIKRHALRLTPGYAPAPAPVSLARVREEFASAGLEVARRISIAPFLSAESIFLLEKR